MSPSVSRQSTGKMTNRPLFAHIQGLPLSQAKVKNLKNTVWKTLFGKHRLLGHRDIQSRFLGRGCDEALFSEKRVFQ